MAGFVVRLRPGSRRLRVVAEARAVRELAPLAWLVDREQDGVVFNIGRFDVGPRVVLGPREAVTPQDRAYVIRHHAELLALLQEHRCAAPVNFRRGGRD